MVRLSIFQIEGVGSNPIMQFFERSKNGSKQGKNT